MKGSAGRGSSSSTRRKNALKKAVPGVFPVQESSSLPGTVVSQSPPQSHSARPSQDGVVSSVTRVATAPLPRTSSLSDVLRSVGTKRNAPECGGRRRTPSQSKKSRKDSSSSKSSEGLSQECAIILDDEDNFDESCSSITGTLSVEDEGTQCLPSSDKTGSGSSSSGKSRNSGSGKISMQMTLSRLNSSFGSSDSGGKGCWTEMFRPRKGCDLAVSIVKQNEVRKCLALALDRTKPQTMRHTLLLLNGPAGCGKTALIRVLADEMDCEIIEFSNVANASSLDVNSVPTALGASRMEQFATWLMMAGRSGSLSLSSTSSSAPKKNGNKKKLLLLEDLPYVTRDYSEDFRRMLMSHMSYPGAYPLVAIIDEQDPYYYVGATGNTAASVLQRVANTHPNGIEIPVHAVTDKRMTTLLQRFSTEHLLSLSRSTIASIVAEAHGDIRSAINMIQFASCSPTKSPEMIDSGLWSQYSRDTSLSFMHAVKRVLKAERVEGSDELKRPAEDILAMLSTTPPDSFIDCCFENCTDSFSSLDQLCNTFDDLSLADTFVRGNSSTYLNAHPFDKKSDGGGVGNNKAVVQKNFGLVSGEIKTLVGLTAFMLHHRLDDSQSQHSWHGYRGKFRIAWPAVVRRCENSRREMASILPLLIPEDPSDEPSDVEDIEDDDDDDGTNEPISSHAKETKSPNNAQPCDDEEFIWIPSSLTSMLEVYPFAIHIPGSTVYLHCHRIQDAVQPRLSSYLDF